MGKCPGSHLRGGAAVPGGRGAVARSLRGGRILFFSMFLAATATVTAACSSTEGIAGTAIPVVDAPENNAAEAATGDLSTGSASLATDSVSTGRRKFAQGAGAGDTAPDFTLPTLQGGDVRLSEFRGSPVIVYFFTRLCGSHTFDLRFLQTFASSEIGDRPQVLVVGLQETVSSLEWLVDRSVGDDRDFTAAADNSLETFLQYQVITVPVTFFIDREGIIQSLHQGFLTEKFLATGILGIQ